MLSDFITSNQTTYLIYIYASENLSLANFYINFPGSMDYRVIIYLL